MRRAKRLSGFILTLMMLVLFSLPAYAVGLDELTNGSDNGSSSQQETGGSGGGGGAGTNQAITDYLRTYNPVTDQNMQQAGTIASPFVNAMGTVSGFIIMCTSAGIFVITALDLAYIGIPPLRGVLNRQQAAGAGGGMPGMGGMGMGMRGGMGMGMAGGQQGGGTGFRLVSDEAVYCVGLASGGQGGAPGMGGMGMGGMGMGMGGMGAMGGMPGAGGGQMPMKSVIYEYFKKRLFFIVLFTIATVILMSSLIMDCGLNLAELLSRIIVKFSGQVSNVTI